MHMFEGEGKDGIEGGFWTRPAGFGFRLPPRRASCVFLNGEAEEEDTELRKREVGFPVHPICSSPLLWQSRRSHAVGLCKGCACIELAAVVVVVCSGVLPVLFFLTCT